MRSVNPTAVRIPDGRTGCLVALYGTTGCIEFKAGGRLERYPLAILNFLGPRVRRSSDKS